MILLTGIHKSFTTTDFWRWWVVHLWVEGFFEVFATVVAAALTFAVLRRTAVRVAEGIRGASVTREPRIPHRRDTDP